MAGKAFSKSPMNAVSAPAPFQRITQEMNRPLDGVAA
jgi:hypothetical protein